ncbi:MAG: DUF2752 domain-containing protein [Labilithrix sp.]|nr:DUF2752 domain-containing protein [Labilithrix sp.]
MPRAITPALTSSRRVALAVAAVWMTALGALGLVSCPTARHLHVPCPGCGMTRALALLTSGDLGGSLAMHPLAVPTALAQLAFAAVTVVTSLRHGTPLSLWSHRYGRASVYALAAVFALDLLLWIARAAGLFGGPVAV